MNKNNIERHAYTNFTGRPYIHSHGVPTKRPVGYSQQPINHNRTIIRTIAPGCYIYADVPSNGMNDIRSRRSRIIMGDYANVGTNYIPQK